MKFSKIIQFVVNFIFCCALIGLCLKSIDDINIQSGKVKNNINLISKRINYPAFSNLMNYAHKIINIMNYMFIIGCLMLIFKISSIGHSFIVTGLVIQLIFVHNPILHPESKVSLISCSYLSIYGSILYLNNLNL